MLGLKNLKKSPALKEKLCNFNVESIESKWLQVDNSVTVEHFFSSNTVPFIKAFIVDCCSLNNLPVFRVMPCLNPDKKPKKMKRSFLAYDRNISTLYDFYGKQRDEVFEGRQVTSLAILVCAADLLPAEYN